MHPKVLKFNPYLSSTISPQKCGYEEMVIAFVVEQENLVIRNLERKIVEKIHIKEIKKVIYSQDSKEVIKKLINQNTARNSILKSSDKISQHSIAQTNVSSTLKEKNQKMEENSETVCIEFALVLNSKKRINFIIRGLENFTCVVNCFNSFVKDSDDIINLKPYIENFCYL